MSTSGGTIVNAVLYTLMLACALPAGFALIGGTEREQEQVWRRPSRTAIGLWLVVAIPSVLQFPFPAVLRALRRDPELIRHHGQVWRVLTSVVVQDSGVPGTIPNLAILAVVALVAVRVWGPVLAPALFVAAQLVFGILATFLSTGPGAGNSGATFGLAASIAGLALVSGLDRAGRVTVVRSLGVVLIGLLLVWLGDAHGIAVLGGVVLGVLTGSTRYARDQRARLASSDPLVAD